MFAGEESTRNGQVFDRLIRYLPQIRDMFTTRMFLCAMSRNEMASLRDHAKVRTAERRCTVAL